ncbi:methylase, partial [Roseobacter sp. TSBP12]
MNAHPHSVPLVPEPEAPARPEASCFAHNLIQTARTLVPVFEAGRSIDAAALRAAMEGAFGASDTSGAWVWKDAYEAAEVAQILMLSRYGALMQRQAASPQAFLTMIERLAALAPSHTRRSEDSVRLQQFSTPLPLAATVAKAAGFQDGDLVLEPSAGTGMLAIFARIADARLALNELAETRRALLGLLFPGAVVSDHDAAAIDDRLDRSITPSVIVMNPPFSAAKHVAGRFRQATSQHVLSALARLAPGGRLVVITGESFRPSMKSFQSTFQRIGQRADVVFSAAIDGKVFARHGTTIDTRLTVIDKRPTGAGETAPTESETAYHPICATTGELLNAVLTHCPERRSPPPCPTSSALSIPSRPTRKNLHALRNAALKETRALAEERAKHPFDDIETAPLDYLAKA